MQFLKTQNKTTLSVVGLTTVIAGAILLLDENWFNKKKSSTKNQSLSAKQVNQPDYFMEDYTIITTDSNGNTQQQLSGKKLQRFPNGNTNLTQPKLQFNLQKQHWILFAEKGTIQENNGKDNASLSLEGNVNVLLLDNTFNNSHYKKNEAFIIQTEQLNILMADKTASTQQPVRIINENGEINATGLVINFDEQQLQLLSNVKGHYVFK